MSVASVDELKEELAFSGDLGTDDDALLSRHLDAAQGLIEQSLGFALVDEFNGEPVPAAIKQAVLWLAVDFYAGRGVTEKDARLPNHVETIISAYREWSF